MFELSLKRELLENAVRKEENRKGVNCGKFSVVGADCTVEETDDETSNVCFEGCFMAW